MAFTDREKKLAEQVKQQGGSRQDFLELLEQMRATQIKTPEFTPTQDPSRKGISIEELQEIGAKARATEVKTPDAQVTEIETEEPKRKPSILGRFVSAGMTPFREDDKREKIQVGEGLTELPDITGKIKDVTGISIPDELAFGAEHFISEPISKFAKGSKEAAKEFTTKATGEEGAMEAGKKMFFNVLPSLGAQGAEIIDTIANPVDTAEGMINLAEGIGQKAVWGVLDSIAGEFGKEMKTESAQTKLVDQIGKDLVEQYGTPTKFKKAFIENPALVLEVGISALKKGGRGKLTESDKKKIKDLEKEAKTLVGQFVDPTTQETKRLTEKIKEGVLGKGIKGTREDVLLLSQNQASKLGKELEELVDKGLEGQVDMSKVDEVVDIFKHKEKLLDAKGKPRAGREADVKFLDTLLENLRNDAGVDNLVDSDKLLITKQAFGKAFKGTDADQNKFKNGLQKSLAKEIRKQLAVDNPKIDELNQKFSFYKNLGDAVDATIKRAGDKPQRDIGATVSQRMLETVGSGLGIAAGSMTANLLGFSPVTGGALGGLLGRLGGQKLGTVISSPKWRIVEAQEKKNLADAIAAGDAQRVEKILDSIIVAQSIKIDTMLEEGAEETAEERKKRLLDLLRPKK